MASRVGKLVFAAVPLLVAGCSQKEEQGSVWDEASDGTVQQAPDNEFGFHEARNESAIAIDIPTFETRAPPGISVTAAPGVAFTYRYAFVLPSDEIAAQQEAHATACEELGREKCRITGMRYKLIDEDRVEAFLQFKLDPALARGFGKDGIATIEDAGGRLVDAVIVGQDADARIQQSQDNSQRIEQTISDLERQLRDGGLDQDARRRIEQQIDRLRVQLRSEEQVRETASESLANTPMTYFYRGDEGFTIGSDPMGDAGSSAWTSFTAMLTVILFILGVALPWILLGLGLLALWRTGPLQKLRNWIRPKPPEAFGEVGEG